jgi:hypothetical protein
MANKTISINPTILSILKKEPFNHFTVIQLRDAFMQNSNETCDSNQARKFIYKQILRFVKMGVLKKSGVKGSHDATYSKSELFYKIDFLDKGKTEILPLSDTKCEQTSKFEYIEEELERSIQEYQVDMMAAIGESEEYMRLFKQFPEMKQQLEEQYLIARENSSKILGKITALNNIKNKFIKVNNAT